MILDDYGEDVAFIDKALARVLPNTPSIPPILPRRLLDGASYALSLGLNNGGLFTHILAFSPGFMAPARTEDSPRFFVSHGVQDAVLPIDRTSRRIVPRLEAAGYEVAYRSSRTATRFHRRSRGTPWLGSWAGKAGWLCLA